MSERLDASIERHCRATVARLRGRALFAVRSGGAARTIGLADGYLPLLAGYTHEDKAAKGLRSFTGAQPAKPEAVHYSVLERVAQEPRLLLLGEQGSGKTTLLRALVQQASARRVVILEDTSELQVVAPHVVALESRLANAEGRGAISLRQLVRQSLRMRPDSIVIGEVRGDEVVDWLLAITSGHRGSATTVHAHSSVQALERLELLASLAGVSAEFARTLIRQSVDAIIHCERTVSSRRISDIHIVAR